MSDTGVVPLLKAVENLKVLDLEHTNIGAQTMASLGQYCQYLEKLYLGFTKVTDEHLCTIESALLPKLQIICLRKTYISCVGLHYLVSTLRSLKYLNVSTSSISSEFSLELSVTVAIMKRLKFDATEDSRNEEYCDHFLLRNNYLER